MEFIVTVEGFKKGIAAAVEAATKETVKDFSGADRINIIAEQTEAKVSAFGGNVGVTTVLSDITMDSLSYVFKSAGETSVGATDLMNILNSFSPEEKVIIKLKKDKTASSFSAELVITLESDEEQYQTLPCFDSLVLLPKEATEFAKSIKIDKKLFIEGCEKVEFAVGIEKEKHKYYMKVVLAADKDSIRFSAGSGARHAIFDVDGKDVVDANPKKTDIIMMKNYFSVISKVLESSGNIPITIKESKKKQQDSPFQVVLECDPHIVIFVGLDPSSEWVDEDTVLNMDFPVKVVTKVADWQYAAKGTTATFNNQVKKEHRSHKANVEMDLGKNTLVLKTNEKMRSHRKVSIVDSVNTTDELIHEFICVSAYLSEMVSRAKGEEYIQIEVVGHKKPIVVCYHAGEKVSAREDMKVDKEEGYSERFSIFFGTHSS